MQDRSTGATSPDPPDRLTGLEALDALKAREEARLDYFAGCEGATVDQLRADARALITKVDRSVTHTTRSRARGRAVSRPLRTRSRESHSTRPGHRRSAASSTTSSSDPGDSDEPGPWPGEAGYGRLCACGCGRSLRGKRADAKTFGASCRQRLARAAAAQRVEPTAAATCVCEAGFFYRDTDGDAVCGLCGCWLTRIEPRLIDYDLVDALMRTNGPSVAQRRRPFDSKWRTSRREVLA